MKFNLQQILKQSPIVLSALLTGISFMIFFIFFLITKPRFIKEMSEEKVYKINYYLLLSYSLMFSILIGLIVFFLKKSEYTGDSLKDIPIKEKSDPNMYIPVTY